MMNKEIILLGVRYPTANDVLFESSRFVLKTKTVLENAREKIKEILFDGKCDYVLTTFDGILYVCEKIDGNNYSRRTVNYHPLASEVTELSTS